MRFSRTSEYALKVFIQLVNSDQDVVSVKALHQQLSIPYKYLAALMRRLANAGFLTSQQGKNGGYRLSRPAGEINIRDIINELEGRDTSEACILGEGACGLYPPCPMHRHWTHVSSALDENIYSLTLADLVRQ
jgi:Rrf2 family protein